MSIHAAKKSQCAACCEDEPPPPPPAYNINNKKTETCKHTWGCDISMFFSAVFRGCYNKSFLYAYDKFKPESFSGTADHLVGSSAANAVHLTLARL